MAGVRQNQFDTDYYYSAYPNTTTNDVLNALALRARLEDFVRTSRGLEPEAFKRAYDSFLLTVSHALGNTGPRRTGANVTTPPTRRGEKALAEGHG
jgi:hypothetical protein